MARPHSTSFEKLASRLVKLALFSMIAYFATIVMGPFAQAAEIKVVKKGAVIIDGLEAKPGDLFFALDSNGKKRAIIEITKSKGGRSAGRVKKGKARPGMTLEPRVVETSTEARFQDSAPKGPSKIKFGALAGFGMDSINVEFNNEAVATAGTGFSVKGVGEYSFSDLLGVRALAGYESINATGDSTTGRCGGGSSCSTSISYLTFDFLGKFNLLRGGFSLWLGGGVGFAVPLNKTTNILAADSITTANILYGALGSDIKMGSWELPIQVDYGLFLPQTEVKTNILSIRVGVLLPL